MIWGDILRKEYIKNELNIENVFKCSNEEQSIYFTMSKTKFNKLSLILEEKYKNFDISCLDITKISVIGNGIMSNNKVLNKILKFITENKLNVLNIQISEVKISILFKEIIPDDLFDQLHKMVIK